MRFLALAAVAFGLVSASPLGLQVRSGHDDSAGRVVGYWSDWTNDVYPATAVPWSKLTHVNYAFVVFGEDFQLQTLCGSTFQNPRNCTNGHKLLADLSKEGHKHGVKVKMSIGGWENSQFFSTAVGSPANRTRLTQSIIDWIHRFDLDGLDIDWEYPGLPGMACNIVSPKDSANLLIYLKELRSALDMHFGKKGSKNYKTISAAVALTPFADAKGNPLKDVSEYAKYFDWLNLMSYDVNGPWSATAAPNGPLYNIPGKGANASIYTGVMDWHNAGFPKDKIVIGIPWYSHSAIALKTPTTANFYVPINGSVIQGDDNDVPVADNCPGQVAVYSGQWKFKNYFIQGVFKGKDYLNPHEGWQRHYDTVTQTPWMYKASTHDINMYDDPVSVRTKTQFNTCGGYGGTMIWSLDMDYGDLLIDAMVEGMKG
ncbi:hypothetical protein BZG36_05663, partial [Bifiguratus adelaidae]